MTPDFDIAAVPRPGDAGEDDAPARATAVRLSRWKTTIPPEIVPYFVNAIGQNQPVTPPPGAPEGAQELARRINGAARRAGDFSCYDRHNFGVVNTQFVGMHGNCAVDLWRFDYDDGVVHAAVSVVAQTRRHGLLPRRTSGGRAFGNHLLTGRRGITQVAVYSSTKYGDGKPAVEDVDTLILAPDAVPVSPANQLHAHDIVAALDVSTVSGPALDDTVWERTEFGHLSLIHI